jgi:hypothetical protein
MIDYFKVLLPVCRAFVFITPNAQAKRWRAVLKISLSGQNNI